MKSFPKRVGVCRSCGKHHSMRKWEFFRNPRCTSCGGIIDPQSPLHNKRTIQKGEAFTR